jgi:uncharacterized protein with PIN domain
MNQWPNDNDKLGTAEWVCEECGTINSTDFETCDECGYSLEQVVLEHLMNKINRQFVSSHWNIISCWF